MGFPRYGLGLLYYLLTRTISSQAIIRKVGTQIEPLADRIMNVQLQLLQTSAKDAAVAEDAFMTISSLVLGRRRIPCLVMETVTLTLLSAPLQSWMKASRSTPRT